jgi:hypothetical protein
MKKRIFAVLLAAAVMLSLAMFASCNDGENDEEEYEEEITITVHVKISANDGKVLFDDDVTIGGLPSNLTAFVAAKRALDTAGIEYEPNDLGMFDSIGSYVDINYADMELEEGEERPAGEGVYWEVMINGKDESGSDRINNGDTVEYIFREVMSFS